MDESNYNPSPPPVPDRISSSPGRAVRIHSIQCIRPETKPNDYVDTTSISATLSAPKRPPKLSKPHTKTSLDSKANLSNVVERHDNFNNELREHLQVCKQQSNCVTDGDSSISPDIPPRTNRPPPLPPRESKTLHKSRPVLQQRKCNSVPQKNTNVNPSKAVGKSIQPSVLIITDQPKFSHFLTSHPGRHHTANADLVLPPTNPVIREPASSDVTLTIDESGTMSNTIICPECGQCRCSDCSGDRKLPERWLCEGNCRCSADSVVNTLSCMCCVKSCFKHCIDNPDGTRADPCACTESPHCLLRWTALAMISLCLPCLCCYGPMQLGVTAATACYNSPCCRKRGCNCDKK